MFDWSWFGSIGFDGFLPALLGAVRHDFGWLGWISFDYTFLSALLSVILIDLVLAGDNAVVIALAVRNLPPKQKKWGIILGAGAAVMLRVVCTMFVAQMLRIPLPEIRRRGADRLDRGEAADAGARGRKGQTRRRT